LVDSRRDDDLQRTLARLRTLQATEPSASVAYHYLTSYLLSQNDHFRQAVTELNAIDPKTVRTPLEQFHIELLRAAIAQLSGEHEAALVAGERALDIAQAMASSPRILRATTMVAQLFIRTNSLERASALLNEARQRAEQLGDEAMLVGIACLTADVADRSGNREAERAASLEAVRHAQRGGSDRTLAYALANLAGSYLKSGEYGESLGYSKQALTLSRKMPRNGFTSMILFNMGVAQIGLGQRAEGKRTIESAIQNELDAGNLVEAEITLAKYAAALEREHDWKEAVMVRRRHEQIRDKLMTTSRQEALLELSTRFDTERKAREIELLKRDNAIKDSSLKAQRLRQQMIVIVALLTAAICAALAWAFHRIRKINRHLRYTSEHDTLTGLYNRRYFVDSIRALESSRRFSGCVVLIDLDRFKRINDTLGHHAGDAVLAAFAKRLTNVLREEDKLVRWGGEEFLILLPPMTDLQLNSTVQRLLNVMRSQPVKWQDHEIRCTASIGYARFPLFGTAFDVTIDRAISLVDKALYHAKHTGRDRACLIQQVTAHSEYELSSINAEFEAAAVNRRVQLVETTHAA